MIPRTNQVYPTLAWIECGVKACDAGSPLLPVQGGGWEGDGERGNMRFNPIPTLALPLKGRELILKPSP